MMQIAAFSGAQDLVFPSTSSALTKQTPSRPFLGILSGCSEMQKIFGVVEKIAKTRSTVLILGESGTGKELIAKALHSLSGRTGKLVPVNCGAIPEDILESELFGHEKGAFTGAISNRIGRFQLADGGTIFLDEIAEMSPKLQVKLLRVLQERKVDPVGSTRSIDVDVRVIAATNKDLAEEVKAGRFREDLFYRLQVVPVSLPPLRERTGDIQLLAEFFLARQGEEAGKSALKFSSEALTRMSAYRWPGNVRELENIVERLAILSESEVIEASQLPEHLLDDGACASISHDPLTDLVLPETGVNFNALVDSYESKLITSALAQTGGNKKAAAKLLGLNRTTLVEKIKKKSLESRIEVVVTAPENEDTSGPKCN